MRLALLCFIVLPACSTLSVPAGHRVVLLDEQGHFSVHGEGVTPPIRDTTQVQDIDLRAQTLTGIFSAKTKDGVTIVVRNPTLEYSLDGDHLVELTRGVALKTIPSLIGNVVQSAINTAVAKLRFDQLDSEHIRLAQEQVLTRAQAQLGPGHILVSSIDLKGLAPRSIAIVAATNDTAVWEQRALQAQSDVELARRNADLLRAEAEGVYTANRAIAPTLLPSVLTDAAAKAWHALLIAPATELLESPQ